MTSPLGCASLPGRGSSLRSCLRRDAGNRHLDLRGLHAPTCPHGKKRLHDDVDAWMEAGAVSPDRVAAFRSSLGLALGLGAGAANALSVHPLFFGGTGGFGFSAAAVAGITSERSADAERSLDPRGRALAAVRVPASIVANHLSAIHENPQGQGRTPSEADPFIVDSTWTISNQTGAPVPASYLVFTKIDIDGRYPGSARRPRWRLAEDRGVFGGRDGLLLRRACGCRAWGWGNPST